MQTRSIGDGESNSMFAVEGTDEHYEQPIVLPCQEERIQPRLVGANLCDIGNSGDQCYSSRKPGFGEPHTHKQTIRTNKHRTKTPNDPIVQLMKTKGGELPGPALTHLFAHKVMDYIPREMRQGDVPMPDSASHAFRAEDTHVFRWVEDGTREGAAGTVASSEATAPLSEESPSRIRARSHHETFHDVSSLNGPRAKRRRYQRRMSFVIPPKSTTCSTFANSASTVDTNDEDRALLNLANAIQNVNRERKTNERSVVATALPRPPLLPVEEGQQGAFRDQDEGDCTSCHELSLRRLKIREGNDSYATVPVSSDKASAKLGSYGGDPLIEDNPTKSLLSG